MAEQRFQLRETTPGLPGEIICAGCKAGQEWTEPPGDSPAGALKMNHAEDCEEVKRLTAGAA